MDSLLNGGAYGIEASIITTVVLGMALVFISVIIRYHLLYML